MSLPYVCTPRPHEWVSVKRDEVGACSIGVYGNEYGLATWVRIPAADVHAVAAGIAAAMHEAAGLPAPVVPERPSPVATALGHYFGGVRVFADGGTVRLQATESHSAKKYWHTRLDPAAARKLAAYIAALADAVEGEPDLAEVEELATLLHDTRETGVRGISGDWDRNAARAALRWMKDKQQRGERS